LSVSTIVPLPFILFNLLTALHKPSNGQHRLINTSLLPNCDFVLKGGMSSLYFRMQLEIGQNSDNYLPTCTRVVQFCLPYYDTILVSMSEYFYFLLLAYLHQCSLFVFIFV